MTDTPDTREDGQKSEHVAVRLTPAVKRALERGAEGSGPSLSDQDRKVFLAALDNPPEPSQALRRAAQRHRGMTGE